MYVYVCVCVCLGENSVCIRHQRVFDNNKYFITVLTEVHCVHLFNAVFELEGFAYILLCALLALLPYRICLHLYCSL